MVASRLGVTLIPAMAESLMHDDDVVSRPLSPAPQRDVVLASRYRFPRHRALEALVDALRQLNLPGTVPLS